MKSLPWKTLLVVALAAHPAVAEPAPAPPTGVVAGVLARLDRNADGKLDRDEYLEFRRPRFARADADANGSLSLAEFQSMLSGSMSAQAPGLFATFDADHSGELATTEVDAYQAQVFAQALDGDKDGFLTAAEIERMAQPAGAPPANTPMDADGNGSVTAAEYVAFQARRFSTFDADGDGNLSFPEFKASLTERAARTARDSFEGFDLNHNMKLTPREYVTFHDFVFKRVIDRNRDDVATPDEFAALMGGQ